ncbi:formyltetrahydrofolate deformylase [Rhodococcus opacus]|uniref:formyltetrahydrofolate deformylase n=1 Tax=Rhodococcus opacus TaxID=37919 RepID=UPI000EA9564B|nr:formyltetrahydrofolate deformylase [Rhodococcus opacus]MDJ0418504.1 formyltetrahydrofolate deformylase [Rhodococcus opacus]QZS56856.1 formyltetrahydrofolate deformylase [Rhodococcus opacus]RKM76519.1 formyltetrahydrofolate deformylase [Rhodococcus opacus]
MPDRQPSPTATLERPPHTESISDIARLLVRCADRPGVVAAVSAFLSDRGANIISLDQHSTDYEGGDFFQRTVFRLPGFAAERDDLEHDFRETVAAPLGLDFRLSDAATPKRVAIMVSKLDHCLLDLLWRAKRGELDVHIGVVIANHDDLAEDVRAFGIPFVHIPVSRDTKPEAEARQLEELRGNYDLVVLARYMQIISANFLAEVGCPIINIHHSFLPAFIGAGPYQRAKERGVKLVGATAHYVTEDLDEGPIIEQDVVRVSHRASTQDLVRLGADVERAVLSRAVQWHCEDRVARHGNTTIVF